MALLGALPVFGLGGATAALAAGNGQLDAGFGSGGFASVPGARLFATAVQGDGKVVVAGDDEASPQHLVVVRFNANGTIDSSFNGGHPALGPANTVARAVAVQSDGKIVVAGAATANTALDPTEGDAMLVERFNANGTPDRGFGSGGLAVPGAAGGQDNAVAIQSDGKIVVGGSDTGPGGFPQTAFARLNSNGSLDGSFGSGGISSIDLGRYSEASAIALQSDGRIVFGGSQRDNLQSTIFLAGRLNSNGSLDGSFGSGGAFEQQFANGAASSNAYGLALQSDGKVVLAGVAADASLGSTALIVRLTSTGHLDSSFGFGGVTKLPAAQSPNQCCGEARLPGAYAVVVSGGEIVAAGMYDSFGLGRLAMWALTSSGGVNTAFATGGRLLGGTSGLDVQALGLAVAPNGYFDVDGFIAGPFSPTTGFVARVGGPPVVTPPPPPGSGKVVVSLQTARFFRRSDVARHGLKVTVKCDRACSIRLTLSTTSAVAQKLHIGRRLRRCQTVHRRRRCSIYYAGGALVSASAKLSRAGTKSFTLNSRSLRLTAKLFRTVKLPLGVVVSSAANSKLVTTHNSSVTIR